MGVRGMNLGDGDEIVAMQLNTQGDYLLVASENGMGKRTAMNEFVVQNRGGKGVKCYKIRKQIRRIISKQQIMKSPQMKLYQAARKNKVEDESWRQQQRKNAEKNL